MLTELVVEGLGVIERAELALRPGCSVLTGETGAGKTLVVAGLGLLLGDRADRSIVREGAVEGRVEGRWLLPTTHLAVERLIAEGALPEEAGSGDVEVILHRTITSDGRSAKARVNGRLVTIKLLEEIAPGLVEIAGQHAHQRIGNSAWQRHTLDRFAGTDVTALADELRVVMRALNRATRAVEDLETGERARRREADVLSYEIAEIEAAGVVEGESTRLLEDAARLENAETFALSFEQAIESLRGDGGAEESLNRAIGALDRTIEKDPGGRALFDRLRAASFEVGDIASDLSARTVAPDPDALEEVRTRIDQLSRLRRKYGDDEEQVLGYLKRSRDRLHELTSDDDSIVRFEKERGELSSQADDLSARLRVMREEAAPRLEDAMKELLGELALSGARFVTQIDPSELYDGGTERVSFLVSANPGEVPRPISKVASGGELSRISLALHLLVSDAAASTMVFDEVDAGVGGQAARSVGEALSKLAHRTSVQVLVVTHLPQVAAFADAHYRVSKAVGDERTRATVERVEGEERVAELSRMLAGLPESERAREHAQELLDMAAGAD
ncbi:MAG: DNA repair protein RecN [Actinomycetota bacterium]|nr:DNA repair protein RecN [Actinomycetota bacterium]